MNMRRAAPWLAAFLCFVATFSGARAEGPTSKLFPFEKATLVYALSGLQTGTQTTYIKDWGAVQAQNIDSIVSMMGFERPFKSKIITTPEWVYSIDTVTDTGMRMANPLGGLISSGETDPEVIVQRMMASLGGTKVGEDSQGGQDCTIWEIRAASTRMCLRDDNVLVYTRTNMMGQTMEINLVSLQTGTADEEMFVVPDMEYSDPPAGLQLPGAP